MSVKARALTIGLAGPAIQAVGIAWTIAHLLLAHLHDPLTVRHVVFEAPFLVILVGFMVSVVCIPVALEVAQASPEDVELPRFETEDDGHGQFGLQPRSSEGK